MCIFFPVLAIERHIDNRFYSSHIETSCVHTNAVRVRPWDVKRFHTTVSTKVVFGIVGAKGIQRKCVVTLIKLKSIARDNEMLIVLNLLNGTVAGMSLQSGRRPNGPAYSPTVTAAGMCA